MLPVNIMIPREDKEQEEKAKYFYFSETKNDICNVNCEVNVFDNEIARILYERRANKHLPLKSLITVLTHISIMNRALYDDCINENNSITIQAIGEKYITNKKCIKRVLKNFNLEVISLHELLSNSTDSSLSAVAPE